MNDYVLVGKLPPHFCMTGFLSSKYNETYLHSIKMVFTDRNHEKKEDISMDIMKMKIKVRMRLHVNKFTMLTLFQKMIWLIG